MKKDEVLEIWVGGLFDVYFIMIKKCLNYVCEVL